MDVSTILGVAPEELYSRMTSGTLLEETKDSSFDTVLSAAMNTLNETNGLQNDAQSAKIQFALGEADNPHDMQIAETKALTALQYTVAVRDKMIEAYKEIMNMQI